jgi:hypothetical protein
MISLLKYWVAILGHWLVSFEEYTRIPFSSLSNWLKFKVQNDLIQCQEEAEEEADEHLHSHFLGPKFSQSLEQIACNTHTHTHTHRLNMHFLEPVAATPAHASYSDSMDIATIFISSPWISLKTQNSHHCNSGGKKEEPCRTTITLLDWLNLIVSRTIPERSAISSEGGKYITCRLQLKTQVKRMQAYLEKHHIIIHGGEESSIEHLHSPWSL